MNKLSYKDFCNSMTMFFVYDDICSNMISQIENHCETLRSFNLEEISTREGLETFIRKYPDSLKNLLLLLDISEEYFKRVISMIRVEEGFTFDTEWSLKKTRECMMARSSIMNKVCHLFLDAYDDEEWRKKIPIYNLRSFKISKDVIQRVSNEDYLFRLTKKEFDTTFNAQVSQANLKRVEETILENLDSTKYFLEKRYSYKITNQKSIEIHFAIKNFIDSLPVCMIKVSFNITTGAGQDKLKEELGQLAENIRDKNLRDMTKLITVIDGAGWLARQSALRLIYAYSDYCINLNHLNDLKEIIKSL